MVPMTAKEKCNQKRLWFMRRVDRLRLLEYVSVFKKRVLAISGFSIRFSAIKDTASL